MVDLLIDKVEEISLLLYKVIEIVLGVYMGKILKIKF